MISDLSEVSGFSNEDTDHCTRHLNLMLKIKHYNSKLKEVRQIKNNKEGMINYSEYSENNTFNSKKQKFLE